MSTSTVNRVSSSVTAPKRRLNRVPYMPGLDGMRALAVVAVMLYHANHTWLGGGFLGVEVFFVISGYLITLLLIGEHERNGRVSLGKFWMRRVRRLLPAVLTMMSGVAVYMALFKRAPQGRTYEIWIMPRGRPLPAGLFPGGAATSVVELTRPLTRGSVVAVSVEPEGGSASLRGPLVFASAAA